MVDTKRLDELTQQVGTDERMGCDQLSERRAQLHINVFNAGLRPFHPAEFGRPENFAGLCDGAIDRCSTLESRVIDEELDVWKVLGGLDQILRMIVFGNRTEWEAFVDAEQFHIQLSGLFQHRIGNLLVIHPPPMFETLWTGTRITFPGIDL